MIRADSGGGAAATHEMMDNYVTSNFNSNSASKVFNKSNKNRSITANGGSRVFGNTNNNNKNNNTSSVGSVCSSSRGAPPATGDP